MKPPEYSAKKSSIEKSQDLIVKKGRKKPENVNQLLDKFQALIAQNPNAVGILEQMASNINLSTQLRTGIMPSKEQVAVLGLDDKTLAEYIEFKKILDEQFSKTDEQRLAEYMRSKNNFLEELGKEKIAPSEQLPTKKIEIKQLSIKESLGSIYKNIDKVLEHFPDQKKPTLETLGKFFSELRDNNSIIHPFDTYYIGINSNKKEGFKDAVQELKDRIMKGSSRYKDERAEIQSVKEEFDIFVYNLLG